jgi:hypothetical protein
LPIVEEIGFVNHEKRVGGERELSKESSEYHKIALFMGV